MIENMEGLHMQICYLYIQHLNKVFLKMCCMDFFPVSHLLTDYITNSSEVLGNSLTQNNRKSY